MLNSTTWKANSTTLMVAAGVLLLWLPVRAIPQAAPDSAEPERVGYVVDVQLPLVGDRDLQRGVHGLGARVREEHVVHALGCQLRDPGGIETELLGEHLVGVLAEPGHPRTIIEVVTRSAQPSPLTFLKEAFGGGS